MAILIGDCRTILPTLEADSFDACVTDPPYDLTSVSRGGSSRVPGTGPFGRHTIGTKSVGFMGKEWDGTGVAFDPETWRAVYRVLKPGARLLAFGGTRTYHRMVCAIEDAGFVIEDTICWLYGSGFPKHASKLKPAHEPICVAWKPDKKATALQIDACRIAVDDDASARNCSGDRGYDDNRTREMDFAMTAGKASDLGRWPANVALDDVAAAVLDDQTGERASHGGGTSRGIGYHGGSEAIRIHRGPSTGGASRFFYCAKASRSERGEGNDHPTVKPLELMRWLVRLVTPPNGLILDCFAGSGTTGIAAALEGFRAVLIEQDAHNAEIATRRIDAAPPRQLAMVAD